MKKVFLLAIIIFSLGCKNNIAKETKARITERRLLENGKLRISYIFKAGFTTVAGIAQVNNTILPVDSIKVVYSPKTRRIIQLVIDKFHVFPRLLITC